jgi:hypothetical protein
MVNICVHLRLFAVNIPDPKKKENLAADGRG